MHADGEKLSNLKCTKRVALTIECKKDIGHHSNTVNEDI